MTTWNPSFTLILVLNLIIYLKAEWDQNTALVVNKSIFNLYYFPKYVYKSPYRGQENLMYFKNSSDDPDSHTFYYCPRISNSDSKADDPEWQHCLFRDKTFTSAAEKLVSICKRPVEPLIILKLLKGNEEINCAQETGIIYQSIYIKERSVGKKTVAVVDQFVQVFEFCYDFEEQLYSYYQIKAPQLLTNEILSEEQKATFDFKNYHYNKTKNNFEHLQKSYKGEYENKYVPQMVASPEFMAFALQRKPLYDYSNVKPMLKGLVQPWNETIQFLRSRIIKKKINAHLYFGTFDVIEELQITEEIQLKVPETWWILIYNESQKKAISILMPNRTEIPPESLLCSNICSDVGMANLTSRSDGAVIYCCPASVITDKLGLKKVNKKLNLE